ncbi:MAG TPA: phage portal protein [Methylophilaceae bacterium]
MATIFGNWYARIKGGWKTVGAAGVGAFDYGQDWVPTEVGPISALKLSAYFACVRLLSETMGSMTFQLYDNANNVVEDHDLYGLLRYMPNQYQTGDAFVSAMAANKTVFGNAMAHIKRMPTSGKPYALDFYATDLWEVEADDQGRPIFKLDGEVIPREDVLHWAGFGLSGYWGLPTLVAGGEAMALQIESNRSAARTFANGLRAGGFFKMPENRQAFSNEQLAKFKEELRKFSLPQNTSKWLPLLPGMDPVANTQFRIDPVTAELLQSRYFGIEEICRFMGVPPPLIGHTDKASSWASSIENLNQFLVTYTMLPQAIRFENQIALRLLGRNERNRLRPKFNLDALLRGDIEKRFRTYEIGWGIGMYSGNEMRAKENLPPRPGGDVYNTQNQGRRASGDDNDGSNRDE